MTVRYAIKYLPASFNDYADIIEYLSGYYESTVEQFKKELKEKIESLSSMPKRFEVFHDDPYFRKLTIQDYLVFYHIDEDNKTVNIHRILHGSRNVKSFLAERKPG